MPEETRRIIDASRAALDTALGTGRRLTDGGRGIDEHQVHAERVAYAATELEACKAITAYARDAKAAKAPDAALYAEQAAVYVGEVAARLYASALVASADFGLPEGLLRSALGADAILARIGDFTAEARIRAIGRRVAESNAQASPMRRREI